jgi:hypothetical protein
VAFLALPADSMLVVPSAIANAVLPLIHAYQHQSV